LSPVHGKLDYGFHFFPLYIKTRHICVNFLNFQDEETLNILGSDPLGGKSEKSRDKSKKRSKVSVK